MPSSALWTPPALTNSVNAIATNLWMGSKPPPDRRLWQNFDVLVLLGYAEEYSYTPSSIVFPNVEVIWQPIDDGKLSAGDNLLAIQTGERVCRRMLAGKRCVVTCNQGRNRSGYICGIALIARGMSAKAAVHRVKTRRSQLALVNTWFVEQLEQYAKTKGR